MIEMKINKGLKFLLALAVAAVATVTAPAPALATAVQPQPPTLTVTAVTDTSISLNVAVTFEANNGTFEFAGVAWATASQASNAGIVPFNYLSNDGRYSTTLTGLTPNTPYYIRACIKAIGTERVYSIEEVVSTTTATTNVSVDLTQPTVTALTTTTARVQSQFTLSANAVVAETGFVWSSAVSDPTVGGQYAFNQAVPPSGNNTLNLEIQNISPGTVFYVKAYAKLQNSNVIFYSAASTNTGQILMAPTVVTSGAVYNSTGVIYANGSATQTSGSTIAERGFVFSTVNIMPTLNDMSNTSRIISNSALTNQSFEGTLSPVVSNVKYYVRAYAINGYGAGYGNVIEVTAISSTPGVRTTAVNNITASGADITFELTSPGDSAVTEKGLVYSKTNTAPELYNEASKYEAYQPPAGTAVSALGAAAMNLSGLEANTVYYVRAYARNAHGTGYGETREVLTGKDAAVTTVGVTDLAATTATASGNVVTDNGYTIQERGFVYSSVQAVPVLGEKDVLKAPASGNGLGAYTVALADLTPETRYYLRAFVRTTQTTSYGETREFTTPRDELIITVTYTLQNGTPVSRQTINAAMGADLGLVDLQPPYGYAVLDPNWKYAVKGPAEVNVLIKTTAPVEKPYMQGDGNYTFAPNRRITRIEVANMIYLLLEGTPRGALNFTDIPANYPYADALSFVVGSGYMQGDSPGGTGQFRPNGTITRAEFAVTLCNVFGLSGDRDANQFTDVENHWGKVYVNVAAQNGAISGRGGGIFDPQGTTTKAEACKMFSIAARRSLQPLGTLEFTDVTPSDPVIGWAYPYIMNAAIPTR
jgi:hypothetical protein